MTLCFKADSCLWEGAQGDSAPGEAKTAEEKEREKWTVPGCLGWHKLAIQVRAGGKVIQAPVAIQNVNTKMMASGGGDR